MGGESKLAALRLQLLCAAQVKPFSKTFQNKTPGSLGLHCALRQRFRVTAAAATHVRRGRYDAAVVFVEEARAHAKAFVPSPFVMVRIAV